MPLLPNGANIPVTNANRTEYILRTANYRLNLDMRPYTQAFLRGLESVIDPDWLRMFNEEELQVFTALKLHSHTHKLLSFGILT